jgi:hypothetical protein
MARNILTAQRMDEIRNSDGVSFKRELIWHTEITEIHFAHKILLIKCAICQRFTHYTQLHGNI